jgi:Domain of unknown function (DUF4296)
MSFTSPIKSFALSLLLAVALVACGADDRPDFLMPQEKIVPILKEMQIAYAGIDITVHDEALKQKQYSEMNALILDRFNVNADTFFLSYDYYQSHPEILDSIYMRVIEELNLEMMPLQKKTNQPKGRVLEDQ